MSVLLGDRKESKFEAITYSIELHDMLILLMQRGFGVKDVDSFVRKKYAYGEISEENFAKYRELMRSFKSKINQCASLITSNVRAANTIYPRTMHEYETRRDYQNAAIVNCVVSSANFANVNNNGNTNYNNASNSNGVRPDSSINQRRRRCYPFRKDK